MRGAGDTMTPMWISIFQTVIFRVPVAYGLCYLTRSAEMPIGNKFCIQVSLLLSWLLGTSITIFFYARGKWKEKIQ
jgi:Na+-driven multidrug efflux pump